MERSIDLSKYDIPSIERATSKGNQLKWNIGEYWIKADGVGYEGLAEYIVSCILEKSNVDRYCKYDVISIKYKTDVFTGCISRDFLPNGYTLVTLETLGRAFKNESIGEFLAKPGFADDKVDAVINFLRELKIPEVEKYITALIELDSLTLNDDRHTNNIAFLRQDDVLIPAPIFDNGGALLSNTMEYSRQYSPRHLIANISAKPFSSSFFRQKQIFERKYGQNFQTRFTKDDLRACLDYASSIYTDDQIIKRVEITLLEQMDKNKDLFVEETCKEELPKKSNSKLYMTIMTNDEELK